jgi:DNA topoisomerase-3
MVIKMEMVLAEKPSVASSIAAVIGASSRKAGYLEGGGYVVSWCVGHLVSLAPTDAYGERYLKWRYADLPIIPKDWKYVVPEGRKAQFDVVAKLMGRSDIDSIICATDAGREGELIFRLVYQEAKCRKPFKRLWISSMEDEAIRAGFSALKDGSEYDRLFDASLCRMQADWIVGINCTRLFSVLYGSTLNVGRVQSPTLAILAEREDAISKFVKETFHIPAIDCGGFTAAGERQKTKKAADEIRLACEGKTAVAKKADAKEKSTPPPKLYDLTALQRDANRMLGYTAQQTLDFAQALYDRKLATYPRTDSQYLTADMESTAGMLVAAFSIKLPFAGGCPESPDLSRIIDSSKVSDHHALIPTMEMAKVDLSGLPSGERSLLLMMAARLLCAVSPRHAYKEVCAEIECGGRIFTAKGRTVLDWGWKSLESAFMSFIKADPNEGEDGGDEAMPDIVAGQEFKNVKASVKTGRTSPPARLTEDTLLSRMENAGKAEADSGAERKGLGTPATRAQIIEKMIRSGYAERKKKILAPTEKGASLVAALPEKLKSPVLTSEWESKLRQVERGELGAADFMEGISDLVRGIVEENQSPLKGMSGLFAAKSGNQAVGLCPRCGGEVSEGSKGFFCANKSCGFAMWKSDLFFSKKKKQLDAATAAALLKDGEVRMEGLHSEKTGKTYNATVVLDDAGEKYVNYKLKF